MEKSLLQPPIQWATWVNRSANEAGNSPPFRAEVKNEWSYASTYKI
jgi:hypothetical protein